jgi:hypothetical protein
VTDQQAQTRPAVLRGTVLEIDYDADTVTVELDDGQQQTFSFELFDHHDIYQPGQRFELKFRKSGEPDSVASSDTPAPGTPARTVSGYVESVDQDDQLVWVYIREEEGWQRKVMPLGLFQEYDLARPGAHFLLEVAEDGTPMSLRPDDAELEMLPQQAEETKPRWTQRPHAEAEPES